MGKNVANTWDLLTEVGSACGCRLRPGHDPEGLQLISEGAAGASGLVEGAD